MTSASLPSSTLSPPRSRLGTFLDHGTVVLVVIVAFQAGSFVARNSDLWLHLATGRLLADGGYEFGRDPFSYATEHTYWANHAWLFDWALYQVFSRLGGAGAVIGKALVVAVTALVMVGVARGPRWLAVGCVALAVLAMSPRLLLQPAVLSYLLLAVCLYGLRVGGRWTLALPAVIAVWVNVDAWFVLGPLLVTLFWVGGRWSGHSDDAAAVPGWLVPACLAACLLSPHHVHAFRLPVELSPAVWSSAFASDPRFTGLFGSPWPPLLSAPVSGASLTAWAFPLLLVLGVVSFGLCRPARTDWRILVWLPFAALACWQARLIPFFAVVAGPITALNLRHLAAARGMVRAGRGLVLSLLAVAVVAGWFGWLPGASTHERATAWRVHSDPTLEHTVGEVVAARQTGTLVSGQWALVTHPELAHYLAWFAPGERYGIDSRFELFTGVAEEFQNQGRRLGLVPGDTTDRSSAGYEMVAMYDPSESRMTHGLATVAAPASPWRIDAVSGAAVLLTPRAATTDARATPKFAKALPVAGDGSAGLGEPVSWWEAARRRNQGRGGSWEADAATVFLRLFETQASDSPALAMAAIRAGRVGVEHDALDPVAWQSLGRAYLMRGDRCWEGEAAAGFTMLTRIRHLQTVAALTQAVLLHPESAVDHELLARVYLRANHLDLADRHADAALRVVRRSASPGSDHLARVSALAGELRSRRFEAENRYVIRSAGLTADPVAQAQAAATLGLVQKAVDVLLASHPDLYGAAGLALLTDLFLQTGQVAECRVLLDRPEIRRNPAVLGYYNLARMPSPSGDRRPYRLPSYDWFDLCQSAATGRYDAAAAAVDRMCQQYDMAEQSVAPALTVAARVQAARDAGAATPFSPPLGRLIPALERDQLTQQFAELMSLSTTQADLRTVAGILATERGDDATATARFSAAAVGYRAAMGAAAARPGEAVAARYNEMVRRRD